MSGAYCLKSCADCGQCGGCPGGAYAARCGIAKCCREKNHESCESCTRFDGCPLCRSRDAMPEKLHEEDRRAQELRQANRERAGVLAKWCLVVFWLLIARIAAGLASFIPAASWATQAVSVVTGLGICYGYLRLKAAGYGFAAVAGMELAVLLLSFVESFLTEGSAPMLLQNLATLAVGTVLVWKRCAAFRDALCGISTEYSEKWENQWLLFRIGLFALLGCIVLAFLPGIGLLGLLGLLVGVGILLFVTIREFVYLYQTARACCSFAAWQ